MGKSQRDKGLRAERELAKLLGGERVPLSGAAGGSFSGDVVAGGLRFECKVSASGFKQLYEWLGDNDALAVKADRKPWLIVMTLEKWKEVVAGESQRQKNGA
ncbi:MAG: hypothetical protein ACYCSN_17520 [Acidobacteriaceae bacterium]